MRVFSAMFFSGVGDASRIYSGGVVRSVLFCVLDMSMAIHSLLGPLVKLVALPFRAPRRLIIIFSPATGSRALMRTASGFPGTLPAVTLKQW